MQTGVGVGSKAKDRASLEVREEGVIYVSMKVILPNMLVF
jgi:hypothetical protein